MAPARRWPKTLGTVPGSSGPVSTDGSGAASVSSAPTPAHTPTPATSVADGGRQDRPRAASYRLDGGGGADLDGVGGLGEEGAGVVLGEHQLLLTMSETWSLAARAASARAVRDLTVPGGTPRTRAVSASDRSA